MTKSTASIKPVSTDICPDYVMLNENGSGYYRFTFDNEGWSVLLENLRLLNAREALTAQDSLLAAYRAGEVDSSVYLKGVEAFAAHPEYDVASKAGDLLRWMYDELPDEAQDDFARFVINIQKDRFEASAGEDSLDGQLLAPTLLGRLVYYGRDMDIMTDYGDKGASYLGLDGEPDKTALASNLMTNSFMATILQREGEAIDVLLDLAKNGSPLEKSAAVSALIDVETEENADRLLALALDLDGPFTGRQSTSIVIGLMHNKLHKDRTWAWFKENFETYVTLRVPAVRVSTVPTYARYFCSKAKRDEAESFFQANTALIPGYERKLAQTLESIELCAALKAEKAQELATALKIR